MSVYTTPLCHGEHAPPSPEPRSCPTRAVEQACGMWARANRIQDPGAPRADALRARRHGVQTSRTYKQVERRQKAGSIRASHSTVLVPTVRRRFSISPGQTKTSCCSWMTTATCSLATAAILPVTRSIASRGSKRSTTHCDDRGVRLHAAPNLVTLREGRLPDRCARRRRAGSTPAAIPLAPSTAIAIAIVTGSVDVTS